jgi:hypothetical protein
MATKAELEKENKMLKEKIKNYELLKIYVKDINLFVDNALDKIEEKVDGEESWIIEKLDNSSPKYLTENVKTQFIRRHRKAKENLQEATKRLKELRETDRYKHGF